MDKIRIYSVVSGAIFMMIAMGALLLTMLGILDSKIAEMIVQGFGMLAMLILLGGLALQSVLNEMHRRKCRRP